MLLVLHSGDFDDLKENETIILTVDKKKGGAIAKDAIHRRSVCSIVDPHCHRRRAGWCREHIEEGNSGADEDQ